MQSLYGQLQRYTYDGKQVQTEEEQKYYKLWTEQQGTQCFNWGKILEVCYKWEMKEKRKRSPANSSNAKFRQCK